MTVLISKGPAILRLIEWSLAQWTELIYTFGHVFKIECRCITISDIFGLLFLYLQSLSEIHLGTGQENIIWHNNDDRFVQYFKPHPNI